MYIDTPNRRIANKQKQKKMYKKIYLMVKRLFVLRFPHSVNVFAVRLH